MTNSKYVSQIVAGRIHESLMAADLLYAQGLQESAAKAYAFAARLVPDGLFVASYNEYGVQFFEAQVQPF